MREESKEEDQSLNLEAQEINNQVNTRNQVDELKSDTDRVSFLLDKVSALGTKDPDDIFLEIMDTLTETDLVPEIGKYYTFIYSPKTPNIRYDQFPLIACVDLYKWGFKGINFHWGAYRNYTWQEIGFSELRVVYPNELQVMRTIPYQYFRINN
jgi:hypothetical protein